MNPPSDMSASGADGPRPTAVSCAAREVSRQFLQTIFDEQHELWSVESRQLAHDIRVKLTAVLGNASLIGRSDDPSSVHRWASHIATAAEGIRQICDTVSELGSSRGRLPLAGIRPRDLTLSVCGAVCDRAQDAESVVLTESDVPDEAVRLHASAVGVLVAELVAQLPSPRVELELASRAGNSGGNSRVLTWTARPVGTWDGTRHIHSDNQLSLPPLVAAALGADLRRSDGEISCEIVTEAL